MLDDSAPAGLGSTLVRHRYLLRQLVLKDFRGKYAGSLLGLFWSVINPLLQLGVYTFLVTVIFQARFGGTDESAPSALYILAGLLPWIAVQEALHRSTTVLVDQANLVTRAKFPVELLPLSLVTSGFLSQLVGVALLMAIIAGLGHLSATSAWLPVVFVIQLMMTAGLALLLAGVAVLFRDLFQLVPVFLMVWLYGTPVIYPAALIPGKWQYLIALNPMTHLVEAYRRVLLEDAGLNPGLAYTAVFAVAALWLGRRVFNRMRPQWADVL